MNKINEKFLNSTAWGQRLASEDARKRIGSLCDGVANVIDSIKRESAQYQKAKRFLDSTLNDVLSKDETYALATQTLKNQVISIIVACKSDKTQRDALRENLDKLIVFDKSTTIESVIRTIRNVYESYDVVKTKVRVTKNYSEKCDTAVADFELDTNTVNAKTLAKLASVNVLDAELYLKNRRKSDAQSDAQSDTQSDAQAVTDEQ